MRKWKQKNWKDIIIKEKARKYPQTKAQNINFKTEQAMGNPKTMSEKGPHSHSFEILGHYELWDFQKYVEFHKESFQEKKPEDERGG